MTEPRTVADVDESALLARMAPYLPRGPRTTVPTGDDAMVLDPSDGRVCVTTDVLVEGHHFRRDWSSAYDIGRRAVTQNLADVAAMGAVPLSIVVAVTLPGDTELAWVEDLCRGLGEGCAEAGAGVDGGDLSGGESVVIAVTAFGDLEGMAPVLRSGARPGDVVAHVGDLGRSAAGLAVLLAAADGVGAAGSGGPSALEEWAVQGFRSPISPLRAGPAAARAGATAMMDVSDGLLRDAGRIARASGVGLDLEASEGALAEAVAALEPLHGRGVDPLTAVLTGGEDHGLLACFPAQAELPEGWRRIGTVAAGVTGGEGSGGVVTIDGRRPEDVGVGGTGWDHFRA